LKNIYALRADFGDNFNSLTSGSIIKDSHVGKIRALCEKQIPEAGGRDSVKASIAQKICFLNENLGKMYSHYMLTEMQTLHMDLENF
jgi:hypothetical protein